MKFIFFLFVGIVRRKQYRWTMFLLIAMSLLNAGCAMSRRAQLEAVARDWFETIRASQVIPVYPMTEDLMPGDIFLVQTPIDKQQSLWKAGDYMPLDNHLARLNPAGYFNFYEKSFLDKELTLPKDWRRGLVRSKAINEATPRKGSYNATNQSDSDAKKTGSADNPQAAMRIAWQDAPGASFPAYTFSVKRGGGANIMVPISSVPVGLSLLGADQAQGTVIIRDARTLGVDIASMYDQVINWSKNKSGLLSFFEPGQKSQSPCNYLRVITRIYLAGKVEVGIQSAESVAGGIDAGAARPVNLLFAKPLPLPGRTDSGEEGQEDDAEDASEQQGTEKKTPKAKKPGGDGTDTQEQIVDKVEEGSSGDKPASQPQNVDASQAPVTINDLTENLNRLNTGLSAQQATEVVNGVTQVIPGGSIRVTMASSRAVSMSETFDPPLILGYLGFDIPILKGGLLGAPIPTYSIVTGMAREAYLDRAAIEKAAVNFDKVTSDPRKFEITKRLASKIGPDWRDLWDNLSLGGENAEKFQEHFSAFCLAYINAEPDGGMALKNMRIRQLNNLIDGVLEEINNGPVQ